MYDILCDDVSKVGCHYATLSAKESFPPSRMNESLLHFDEIAVTDGTRSNISGPQSFSPRIESASAVNTTRDGFFSRLAAVFYLPVRNRTRSTPHVSESRDEPLEVCPVCSLSFTHWDSKRRQIHVEECINKTEASGSVLGDRYSTHRWRLEMGSGKECSICYEEFLVGQRIAVLNCLCQYHEKCINAWFERGKHCPYHTG